MKDAILLTDPKGKRFILPTKYIALVTPKDEEESAARILFTEKCELEGIGIECKESVQEVYAKWENSWVVSE